MYTAMAARRSGAVVSLYAPRPEPMPEPLQQVAASLTWLGPSISTSELARFEISYKEGCATYVNSYFGAEDSLAPEKLPDDLSDFDVVHIVPLGDLARQLAFLLACRSRGARLVSAGTALHLINAQPEDAAAVLQGADIFFMNEAEAVRLFGSMAEVCSRPDQLMFVTQGSQGATVIQGNSATKVPGVAGDVLDPTGAGDSFCGATLVGIASGLHPVMAARAATPLAAEMISEFGPAALLRSAPAPTPCADAAVIVNTEQLQRIATLIADLPAITPYAFVDDDLPAAQHPAALDYFFATSMQQFGFWSASDGRYAQALRAYIRGAERKGAFYLFRGYLRWLEDDPERLSPAAQAVLSKTDLRTLLRADDGSEPMPVLDLHLELARRYGQDMLALDLTPQSILQQANASASPLRALLQLLDHVGGYKEDPLRKKSALLGIILQQRPEAFLIRDATPVPPIVDYHVMRSCLRMGLIDVTDDTLAAQLTERRLLTAGDEWSVRSAAYAAMQQLVEQSGKSMGAIDWFFFQARQRCPEMSEPLCSSCAVDPACAHRKTLFQPVRRTSFY